MQPRSLREWSPLLDEGTRDRVLRAVQEIAGSIRSDHPPSSVDATLGGGAAGLALLFSNLSQALHLEPYAAEARRYQDAALAKLSADSLPVGLVDGFAGVCAMNAFLDMDGAEDSHREIELALANNLPTVATNIGLEMARGLVGCGVYALERWPKPGARRCLRTTIDILSQTASFTENGVSWLQSPPAVCGDWRRDHPHGYVHFGHTHGMAGIIAFLARCLTVGVDERTRPLLRGAVDWVLAHRSQNGSRFAFPTLLSGDAPSTPGWVYGDLAMASSLLMAAQAAGEFEWRRQSIDIACRIPWGRGATEGIANHALCHGAAGMAHMYNRMAQCLDPGTERNDLAERARWWLTRCFEMRRAGHGIAGFLAATDPAHQANPANPSAAPGNPGLLVGAAGTALVLLAFVSDVPPDWDRLFLLSN